jgi:hypothetical protein
LSETTTTAGISYSNTTTSDNNKDCNHLSHSNHNKHRRNEPVLKPEYLKHCDSFHNDTSKEIYGSCSTNDSNADEWNEDGSEGENNGYQLLSTVENKESDYSLDFCNFLDMDDD